MHSKPSRILVCGGREFNDRFCLFNEMNKLVRYFARRFAIIQGGAPGADFLAGEWAKGRGTPNIEVKANWDYYGKSAGTIRNEWMADFCMPELCIHFPGGTGTARMVAYCKSLGIPTYGPV